MVEFERQRDAALLKQADRLLKLCADLVDPRVKGISCPEGEPANQLAVQHLRVLDAPLQAFDVRGVASAFRFGVVRLAVDVLHRLERRFREDGVPQEIAEALRCVLLQPEACWASTMRPIG